MKKFLLLFFSAVFCSLSSLAKDFVRDGICYDVLSESSRTVVVTYGRTPSNGVSSYYKIPRKITIPSEVLYGNKPYKVVSIGAKAFRSCSYPAAVFISEGIESIGMMSFEACGSVERIVLPSTLTRIDDYGLENCQGLKSIICYAINPPDCGLYALNLNLKLNELHPTKICNVYVPAESVDRYKQAKGWSRFPIYPIEGERGEPQLVDLGLSVRWADRNYHAELPSDYGEFYGWGGAPGLDINSYPSQTNIIATEYDICYKENHGLRLPLYAEITELATECEWTDAEINGHKGFNVKGPSGNSIFIPAAGSRNVRLDCLEGDGLNAFLWSGEASSYEYSRTLHIDSWTGSIYSSITGKYEALSVRAVENAAESGIGQITEDENDIMITAERRAIKIENAPDGELCQIYQIDGKMLESSVITGDTHYSISLTPGIYIVKVGNVTRKIMIR